jgi:hypothetical protein
MEPLLHMLWDLWCSVPDLLPYQGCATPNSHPSDPQDLCGTNPYRQGYTDIYDLHQATPLKPAQHCTIFTLQGCAPKACQAGDPYTRFPFCLTAPPKPVKPGIHRHAGSPFLWPVPFRHSKSMLQTSAKGLLPKAHGTPPTIHLPQEGSKPT